MTTNRSTAQSIFAMPSRGIVLGAGMVGLAITVIPSYWSLPLVALVVTASSLFTPLLGRAATPRFIAMTILLSWLVVMTRRLLSYASVRLADADLIELRTASLVIAGTGLIVTVIACRQIFYGRRLGLVEWILIAAWIAGSGIIAIVADPEPWIDVWHLHRDASAALSQGGSPYSGRYVPNPMPWFPEGSVFEGYVYPPLILYTFALADLLLGDSRWVAIAAGLITAFAIRRLSRNATSDGIGLFLVLTPAWPLMVQLSWTESLSVTLVAVAFASRSRTLRSVLLGLLIATKQYLLLLAVPIAVSWFGRKTRLLVLAGFTALLAYAIGLFYGPAGYFEWVFVFHLTTPDATIGSGLAGLSRMLFQYPLQIPSWLSIGAGLVVGCAFSAKRPRSDGSMLLAGTLMLFVVFLTGSQTFPNYWYFVLGCIVVAMLALRDEGATHESMEMADATSQVSTLPADSEEL